MIVLNPGSTLDKLDYTDFYGPATLVSSITNNPSVLV